MDPRVLLSQKAAPSYSVEAKEISQGRSTSRVRFTNTDSSAYDVAAKTLSKTFPDRVFAFFAVSSKKYVEVKINNQKVLLNVNSIANRLHINKNEIISESKKDSFIQSLSQKAEITEKVLNNYNDLLSKHFLPAKGAKAPLHTLNGETTPLTKESILKVIHIALHKELGSGIEIMGGAKPMLALHQEKGKVDLVFIEHQLGAGGNAKIFSADDGKVYKLPKRIEGLPENNRNEAQIVNKLNANGPNEGVSLPMHLVECFNSNSEPGILMPQYDHDYSAMCPTESNPLTSVSHNEWVTIVSEFQKLLSGLNYIHSQGILHGDIKPANILLKEGRTDIIDFGEARDIQHTTNLIPSGITSDYNHFNDLEKRGNETDSNKIIAIEKARDVFALGSTFFRRFNDATPFKETSLMGFQEGIERNSLPEFVPKALVNLIEGMTHPDIDQRLSTHDATIQIRDYQTRLNKLPELEQAKANYIKEMNHLMGGSYILKSREKMAQEIETLNTQIGQEKDGAAQIRLTLRRNQLTAEMPKLLSDQEKVKIRQGLERIKGELAKINEELHFLKDR